MKCFTLGQNGKVTAGIPALAPLIPGNDEPFRHVSVGLAKLPIAKSVDMASGFIDNVCYRASQSGRSIVLSPGGGSDAQAGAALVMVQMAEDAKMYAGQVKDGPESRWRNAFLAKRQLASRPFSEGEAWQETSEDDSHSALAAMLAHDAAENVGLLILQPGAYVSVVKGGATLLLLDWDGDKFAAHTAAKTEPTAAKAKASK